MKNNSTYLGTVQDVSGTTIRVAMVNDSLSGLTYVDGEGYKIGQIGSFVKIPIGYNYLFGIITQVGASAVPENQTLNQPYGNNLKRSKYQQLLIIIAQHLPKAEKFLLPKARVSIALHKPRR